jgi:hypothetical protein
MVLPKSYIVHVNTSMRARSPVLACLSQQLTWERAQELSPLQRKYHLIDGLHQYDWPKISHTSFGHMYTFCDRHVPPLFVFVLAVYRWGLILQPAA